MDASTIRFRTPTEHDHAVISPLLNSWWGGREMRDLLPRLFFQHFTGTSSIAETEEGALAGFIIAFVSQDRPSEGYIHFVGVDPALRGSGVGASLYEHTFAVLAAHGCTVVKAVTAPVNTGSIAFHASMGFEVIPDPTTGERWWHDYDGSGSDRVVFSRSLVTGQQP